MDFEESIIMIILLTGKASVGKSTAATYLQDKYNFSQDMLAAPLKRLIADIFCIPYNVLNPETPEDRKRREEPLEQWPGWTSRQLLQFIGTELFRTNIAPDVWVRSLWLRILNKGGDWAISDVRFPNEQSFFHEHFPEGEVVTIKILRPGFDGAVGLKGHASEANDLPADYIIDNNGDFENLYLQIDVIMSKCLLGAKHTQVVV
jgi:hypothetical protein